MKRREEFINSSILETQEKLLQSILTKEEKIAIYDAIVKTKEDDENFNNLL